MTKNVLWIIIVSVLLFLPSLSLSATLTVKSSKTSPVALPFEVDSVSTGPRDSGMRGLRVILWVDEIYYSIAIEEISYGMVEGDNSIILHTYLLNGLDVARSLGKKRLTALGFIRWTAWNQFELEDHGLRFSVRYTPERTFEISTVTAK